MRSRRPGGRRAHSAVEFVIATVILGLALIPMFGIFSSSRETAFKSKISYMALHVARERLEELRQVPFALLETLVTEDWVKTEGSAFTHTAATRNDLYGASMGVPYALDDPAFDYPEDYGRIFTRVTVEALERKSFAGDSVVVDPGNYQAHPDIRPSRLKRVVVEYYWQEQGEPSELALHRHFNEISTIIGAHNVR